MGILDWLGSMAPSQLPPLTFPPSTTLPSYGGINSPEDIGQGGAGGAFPTPGAGGTPVKTVPITRDQAVPPGGAAAPSAPGGGGGATSPYGPILDALRSRLTAQPYEPKSRREQLTDALMQAGQGMIAGATVAPGTKGIGPSFMDSLSSGASGFGKSWQETEDYNKGLGTLASKRLDELTKQFADLGVDMSKVKSLDEYRSDLIKLGKDKADQKLIGSLLTSYIAAKRKDAENQGIPFEMDPQLQAIIDAFKFGSQNGVIPGFDTQAPATGGSGAGGAGG